MRVLYVVSHPIQYQAPLLRRIAALPHVFLQVLFEYVPKEHDLYDPGFKRDVAWDVPLTDGYAHRILGTTDLTREVAQSDVVWLHGWRGQKMRNTLMLANLMGKPVMMRGENCDAAMPDGGPIKGPIKRFHIQRVFDACSIFLPIGKANEAYYLNRGVSPDKMFSMPYAIDNDRFREKALQSKSKQNELRTHLGISDDRPIILFAGKLMERKRPDLLVSAVEQGWPPEERPHLLIVGDGELHDDLAGSAPWAIFEGFINQTDLPDYYALADVFVLPSEREPWGLAVNEAMACGTAVVVSDEVGCAPDLVTAETGVVFESRNVTALINALKSALSGAEVLGASAQRHISQFSFDQDIEGFSRALESLRHA